MSNANIQGKPCRCGCTARNPVTNRCVTCEKGRTKARYVKANTSSTVIDAEELKVIKELQRKRWLREEHQERMAIILSEGGL